MVKKNITEVIKDVKNEIEQLGGETPCYKVTDLIGGVNIQTEKCIKTLIRTLASVRISEKAFSEVSKDLGLDVKYDVNGSDILDIEKDVKTRINAIVNEDKINSLTNDLKELEALVSDEEKREAILKRVATKLS